MHDVSSSRRYVCVYVCMYKCEQQVLSWLNGSRDEKTAASQGLGSPLKSPALVPMTHEETLKAMLKASLNTAPPVRHNGVSPLCITGVSAGLPGKDRDVFSNTNLAVSMMTVLPCPCLLL